MGYELTIFVSTYRLSKVYYPPFGSIVQDQVKPDLLVGKDIYWEGRLKCKLCFF
jgi:hypothetical protein